jgi:hypothetical protein
MAAVLIWYYQTVNHRSIDSRKDQMEPAVIMPLTAKGMLQELFVKLNQKGTLFKLVGQE